MQRFQPSGQERIWFKQAVKQKCRGRNEQLCGLVAERMGDKGNVDGLEK